MLSRSTSRRSFLTLLAWAFAAIAARAKAAAAEHEPFIDTAFKMRDDAIRSGDQPYGAVVVKDRRVIGFGPSRVVLKNDIAAHAEREAIREAKARLGSDDLSGCILYSTSRPCAECQRVAAQARIARMFYGRDAADAGAPA